MKKTVIISVLLIIAVLIGAFFLSDNAPETSGIWGNAMYTEDTELGDGEKTVKVEVIAEEKSVTFTIHSDKETVGEALSEHKLIDGEEGPYGLYVKFVNGIKADYDENQTYWAFSKDGESLNTGVDVTELEDGEKYELVYTK